MKGLAKAQRSPLLTNDWSAHSSGLSATLRPSLRTTQRMTNASSLICKLTIIISSLAEVVSKRVYNPKLIKLMTKNSFFYINYVFIQLILCSLFTRFIAFSLASVNQKSLLDSKAVNVRQTLAIDGSYERWDCRHLRLGWSGVMSTGQRWHQWAVHTCKDKQPIRWQMVYKIKI